jgi:hypothetical protein
MGRVATLLLAAVAMLLPGGARAQYDSCPAAQLGSSWALGVSTVVGVEEERSYSYTLTRTGDQWDLVQTAGGSDYSLGTSDGSLTEDESGVVSMATTGGDATGCADVQRSATVELRGPTDANPDGSLTATEPAGCVYVLVLYTSGCSSSCYSDGEMRCGPCFTASSFDGYDQSAVTETSLDYDSFDVAIDTSGEPNAGCAAGYYWANGGPAATRCDVHMTGYNLEGCTDGVMYNCPALGDFAEPMAFPSSGGRYVVEFDAVQPTERTCTIPGEFSGCDQPADGDTSCPSLDTSAGSYCVFTQDPDFPGTCDTAPYLDSSDPAFPVTPDSTTGDTWVTASDECVGTCQTGFNADINFQPAAVGPPAGYLVDSGATYGARDNGFEYGWSCDLTADTRDRDDAGSRWSTLVRPRATPCAIQSLGTTLARLPWPILFADCTGQRRCGGMRRHALEDQCAQWRVLRRSRLL